MAVLFPQKAELWPLTSLSCLFLQRQVAGEVQTQPQDRAINQIAMMLAIMGLSLSYYSAKQMTEKVQAQPAPWRDVWLLWSQRLTDEPVRSEGGGSEEAEAETFDGVFQDRTILTSQS